LYRLFDHVLILVELDDWLIRVQCIAFIFAVYNIQVKGTACETLSHTMKTTYKLFIKKKKYIAILTALGNVGLSRRKYQGTHTWKVW